MKKIFLFVLGAALLSSCVTTNSLSYDDIYHRKTTYVVIEKSPNYRVYYYPDYRYYTTPRMYYPPQRIYYVQPKTNKPTDDNTVRRVRPSQGTTVIPKTQPRQTPTKSTQQQRRAPSESPSGRRN